MQALSGCAAAIVTPADAARAGAQGAIAGETSGVITCERIALMPALRAIAEEVVRVDPSTSEIIDIIRQ